jgi:hypothetical protein
VSLSRIKDELSSAYAAQLAANGGDPAQAQPPIQLLLANEDTSQELAYGQVTSLLKNMKAALTNLRALIGIGVSVTPTFQGAGILSRVGISMIGAVTTADQLNWSKGMARVVPDVHDQIKTLQGYFAAHGGLGPAFLVVDADNSDIFIADLKSDLVRRSAST